MMKAPLRPGTRPVGAATLAVEDTSTDGPVVAATPRVTARGPKTAARAYLLTNLTVSGGQEAHPPLVKQVLRAPARVGARREIRRLHGG